MPFGLEGWPLEIMGTAIDKVVAVAHWVAGLSDTGNTGFIPLSTVLLGTVALIIATQLKSWLRVLSVPILALGVTIYAATKPPDILISESGNSIAIVDRAGNLHLLRPSGLNETKETDLGFHVRLLCAIVLDAHRNFIYGFYNRSNMA
jgi:hypothetical protein